MLPRRFVDAGIQTFQYDTQHIPSFRQVRHSEPAMQSHFRLAYQSHQRKWPLYGSQHSIATEQWWRSLVQEAFSRYCVSVQVPEEMFQELYQCYGRAEAYELLPLGRLLVSRSSLGALGDTTTPSTPSPPPLSPPPYMLISNSDERIHDILRALGLLRYFAVVVDSRTAGYEKPQREIFDLALKRWLQQGGVTRPLELLHVGDDYVRDVQGAQQAGWQGMLVGDFVSSLKCENN